MSMLRLEVWHNGNKEEDFLLERDVVSIGRSPDNAIVINDPSISRNHAEIEHRDDGFYIRDLDSKNGVLLNGMPVLEALLTSNDWISIGETILVFSEIGSSSDTEDIVIRFDDAPLFGERFEKSLDLNYIRSDVFEQVSSDTQMERLRARIRVHFELGELVLDPLLTLDSLIKNILQFILKYIDYDVGSVFLSEPGKDILVPRAIHRNPNSETNATRISQTIINECYAKSTAIITADAGMDPRFSESDSIPKLSIHSVICVPLIGRTSTLGIIYICGKEPENPYTEQELCYLIAISDEVSLALENFLLRESMKHQERMASIGRTIAGLSHYLKNILLVAESSYSLLEKAITDENLDKIKQSWSFMKDNNQKLTELIQDMLLYAKAKPINYEMRNINVLIQEISLQISPTLENNNIQLSLDLDEQLPPTWTDSQGFYRILLNLIINAIESLNGRDDGTIHISTEIDESKDHLVITVQDNGCGILPEDMQYIYEPFFSTKGRKGTGLGLALTKRLVTEWGGTLECDSQVNLGSTFIIRLPLLKEKPEISAESSRFFTPFME